MSELSYIPALLAAYDAGHAGPDIHLGLDPEHPPGTGDTGTRLRRAQERMTEFHLDRLDARDGHRIADLGCGLGNAISRLDAALSGAALIGVNPDPRQMERARRLPLSGRNRVTWMEMDAADALVQMAPLDRALSIEAMFHFPDPGAFLRALSGALRPGGRAVLSTILFRPVAQDTLQQAIHTVCRGFAPWRRPELSLADVMQLASAAGFESLELAEVQPRLGEALAMISRPVPPRATLDPVVELRRLLERDALVYPVLTLERR